MFIRVISLLFLLPFTSSVFAQGPFGLEMGMSKAEIEEACGCTLEPVGGLAFGSEKAPKGHPDIDLYAYVIGTNTGLCLVSGQFTVKTSSHGVQMRQMAKELADLLSQKYGQPELEDKLLPGSIWSEPKDWMIGLVQKERVYEYTWDRDAIIEKDPFNSTFSKVYLKALGASRDEGKLILSYAMNNFQQCIDEERESSLDVF